MLSESGLSQINIFIARCKTLAEVVHGKLGLRGKAVEEDTFEEGQNYINLLNGICFCMANLRQAIHFQYPWKGEPVIFLGYRERETILKNDDRWGQQYNILWEAEAKIPIFIGVPLMLVSVENMLHVSIVEGGHSYLPNLFVPAK